MPRNIDKPLGAVTFLARTELRGRWRALVVLGAIAGVAAGLTLASVAGARRTATVYDRYREATAAPDALVFGTLVGLQNIDYSPVLALPEVVDGGTFNLAPVGIQEHDMGTLAPGDDRLYRTLGRPLLVQGRLPDPKRADEVVINRKAAAEFGLRVGDRLTVASSTDLAAFFTKQKPTGGPSVPATIVGIGDSPLESAFGQGTPGFIPSAAFLASFPEVPRLPNLVVRLRPGTDVNTFRRNAVAALGLGDIPVRDLGEDRKRYIQSTDLERSGLLIFAAATLLAGLVMVGQALTRTVEAMAESTPTLRALGLTRSELVAGLVLPVSTAAATAGVIAVASALALSERFPVGLGRSLEPDPGAHADWWVLAPGAMAVAVLILVGAACAALRATRSVRRHNVAGHGSGLLKLIRRRAPLPIAIGAGLALDGGHGDRSLPVRPALAGAVAGVFGVIGALGLVAGIDDALTRPSRAGQVWDAAIVPSDDPDGPPLFESLRQEPDIGDITEMDIVSLDVNGAGLPVYALTPVRGNLSFVVLRGRAPQQPDEVALAPASSKALGKTVGDRLTIEGPNGRVELEIVGSALLVDTPHTEFDQGAWTMRSTINGIADRAPNGGDIQALVSARPGAEPAALVRQLQERYAQVEPAAPPQDVLVLRNVRTLPRALAAFLVVLGLAALSHTLVTAVRRRRHDLAVLRAIGFLPRQNVACILSQATTIALVGLVLGIPLGALAGRAVWRWVAEATPLLYRPPLAVLAIGLAIPVTVLAAAVLAALPARRAARLRPADVLRTE